MKHIKLFEEFISEREESAVNEYETRSFKPANPSSKDIIPPQSPVISALPDATNSAKLYIDGFTEAGANVELLLNDSVDKLTKADSTGYFIFDTLLISGQNRIQFRAKDEAGNESMSEVTIIEQDSKPVVLNISTPKNGNEYFGKTNQVIDIKGDINKLGGQVLINSSFVQVDKTGAFVHRYMLSSGENTIKITASDKAGNSDETTLKVVYTP